MTPEPQKAALTYTSIGCFAAARTRVATLGHIQSLRVSRFPSSSDTCSAVDRAALAQPIGGSCIAASLRLITQQGGEESIVVYCLSLAANAGR